MLLAALVGYAVSSLSHRAPQPAPEFEPDIDPIRWERMI